MSESKNRTNTAQWEVREDREDPPCFLVVRIGAEVDPANGRLGCHDVAGEFDLQELAELYCEVVEERENEISDWPSLPVFSEKGLSLRPQEVPERFDPGRRRSDDLLDAAGWTLGSSFRSAEPPDDCR